MTPRSDAATPPAAAQDVVKNWWGYEANGCKPGTGFVLVEKNGRITAAHIFYFQADSSDDPSGLFLQMNVVRQDGDVIIAETREPKATDDKPAEKPREKVRLSIKLDAAVGNLRTAIVKTVDAEGKETNSQPRNLKFVLQGDCWK